MMVRFTCGELPPIYLNSINIKSMRPWKSDARGPTTRIEMVGGFFDYVVVDGLAGDNAKRVNEAGG